MKKQILDAVQQFYQENQSEWKNPNESTLLNLWNCISCEVYLQTSFERCRYPGGQEFPEYKFLLSSICMDFNDFPSQIDEVANEIFRVAEKRTLETIFISDRMDDGYVDYLEWQHDFSNQPPPMRFKK
jgi:hypothetical protein